MQDVNNQTQICSRPDNGFQRFATTIGKIVRLWHLVLEVLSGEALDVLLCGPILKILEAALLRASEELAAFEIHSLVQHGGEPDLARAFSFEVSQLRAAAKAAIADTSAAMDRSGSTAKSEEPAGEQLRSLTSRVSPVPFLLELPMPGANQEIVPERIAPDIQSVTPRARANTGFDSAASSQGNNSDDDSPPATLSQQGSRDWKPYLETLHFFGASLQQPLSSQESEALIKAGIAEEPIEAEAQQDNHRPAACTPKGFEAALASAFSRVDEDFGKGESAALVGTTVVVALVGSRQLYVANCGDSRAVLCRGNVAIPLTEDHKAAREDEVARIEALGGQILYWNGVRVMGVLAVSRAVGDHYLRPFVIARPEVTIIARRPEDELLLLASDGLWDVLSNQEAVILAKRCLRRARQRGASRQSAARIAATVLTRAAFDRGSRDNVTVAQ
ncbi:hypothetical protein WJX73_006426 [Symbiochloris irregularis]|uniref:PPM-type phosphatase domain-containing protein n=1 Tax=Symbiochloris irregularis TaxID=706552 RepID=A0AAW1NVE8_9CHLO